MTLPLDASTAPFREKYLDETPMFSDWMIFGSSLDGKTCDISNSEDDIITKISLEKANRIIAARAAFCKVLHDELALQ